MPARLADFAGRWRVARTIADALGPDARFSGQAEFAPLGAGLRYRETGMLRVAGAGYRAERCHFWRAGDGAGEILVSFPDGRFFHRFGLHDAWDARHDCAPDTYDVRYDFTAWPRWRTVWRVAGPHKDYVMTTRYRPAPAADAAD